MGSLSLLTMSERRVISALEALLDLPRPRIPCNRAAKVGPSTMQGPLELFEQAEMAQRIKQALTRLPERDALILSLYYVEEFNYQQIGDVLGVSESRVCQLHSRALSRLRVEFDDDVNPGEPTKKPVTKKTSTPRPALAAERAVESAPSVSTLIAAVLGGNKEHHDV